MGDLNWDKGVDLIVDLCILVMNLADLNCEVDPILPFKNLSQIILAKYSAYSEGVSTSLVKMAMFWFKFSEKEISVVTNEELVSYILSLKDLLF